MGKKQHSKDRMFITKTEWATEWGGAKSKENRTPFKSLPFYCCAYVNLLAFHQFYINDRLQVSSLSSLDSNLRLTFLPFEDPVCTTDGSVFELT